MGTSNKVSEDQHLMGKGDPGDVMRAIVQHKYGSPEVLELQEVDKPIVGDDDVLIRVHAAGVNPADWHYMTGTPTLVRIGGGGLSKPKRSIPGLDLAGRVEAVGRNVTEFQRGDEVFGENARGYADYACVPPERVVRKPSSLTFEQAAAVPIAALTALQGLRDKGHLQASQKVLINGASGGVGTFAVQIAKAYGATVTGVCSARNVEMVRSIGADHVVDYTRGDFTETQERFDVILDTVGTRELSDLKRLLTTEGTYVGVGGPKTSFRLLSRMFKMFVTSVVGSQKMVSMLARQTKEDLVVLQEMLESGEVTPVIDRTYPLSETPEALRYLGEGHVRGKVVITVVPDPVA